MTQGDASRGVRPTLGLAPLNLLVILNAHIPEMLAEALVRVAVDARNEECNRNYDDSVEDDRCSHGSAPPFVAHRWSPESSDRPVLSQDDDQAALGGREPGLEELPAKTPIPPLLSRGVGPSGVSLDFEGPDHNPQDLQIHDMPTAASPTVWSRLRPNASVTNSQSSHAANIMSDYLCERLCPRLRADADECERRRQSETKSITLIMSTDNVAAILVLTALSVLGAIYLWKICTRQRCTCKICRALYTTKDLIGSGGYGSVHLVQRIADGQLFVSKKIEVRDITEVDEYSLEAKELVKLRHKHIVSYEDDFVHVEFGTLEPKTFFVIIMEYCPEGDLKQKIEEDFDNFTEEWVRTVFAQVLQAVQYLHSKNVIHRDLKSQNVFLAHDGRVRLGDFGLCIHTRSPALGSASLSHAGTDCYMAPEMLSSSRYGKPADMWSLGCVLYELCSGQFMWELDGILGAMVMQDSQCVQKLIQAQLVPCIGSALQALIKRLLSINPAARPTGTDCIRKKLFKRSFPLSRQLFGEALGDLESSEAQISQQPSTASRAEDSESCDRDICGSESGGDDSISEPDEDRRPSDLTTRNGDLPRRKRRIKRHGNKKR